MYGRTLATTEQVIAIESQDTAGVTAELREWCAESDLAFHAVAVGESVGDVYERERVTLGVPVGGDGTFLEAVQQFAPRDVPMLGINTGTLAFLTRVTPTDMKAALAETVRGRARVGKRQQLVARTDDFERIGVNDVVVQAVPPEDPTERKITRLHAFVDDEYVGEYEGTGLVVSTPTGSTGLAMSAGGPVHYPEDDFTLQIVPLSTHTVGARPLVVGANSEVAIVAEEPADLLVDGGRGRARLGPDDVVTITGSDKPAQFVRTSHDQGFFASLSSRLGWGLRGEHDDGPAHLLDLGDGTVDETFLERARRIAVEAAASAAEPLRALHGEVESIEFKTSKADIVTEADYRAENIITTAIANEFPDHNVRSEEEVQRDQDSTYTWVVDPLDGTGNFAHGNPNYAVSIGLLEGGNPVVGVVHSPETRETFTAIAGNEAHEDGVVLRTTDRERLDESMLLSGYDPDGSFLSRFYQHTRGVRRIGSVALNLCYLASGSADAIWEYDTYPWDVAAGLVIARAAGAEITDSRGEPYELDMENIEKRRELLGTNGPLHDAVLDHLRTGDADLVQ